MISKAQAFIVLVMAILIIHPELSKRIKDIQEIVDVYNFEKQKKFCQNFYSGNKNNFDKDYDSFIEKFNEKMLNIHILAKSDHIFVPLSPLYYEKNVNCEICFQNNFVEYGGTIHCDSCGLIKRNNMEIAWSDISRLYSSPLYLYDRKLQFKELLLQYQGKCGNVDYSILDGKKIAKMSKISFLRFIKVFVNKKICNEQIHALYYHYMKIEKPNLTKIENEILEMFDMFVKHYTEMYKTSTIYVSNQFLMYQILNNCNLRVSKDDVLLVENKFCDEKFFNVFKKLNFKIY